MTHVITKRNGSGRSLEVSTTHQGGRKEREHSRASATQDLLGRSGPIDGLGGAVYGQLRRS